MAARGKDMYEEKTPVYIEPFWNRFPYFFTFPASPRMLPATIGLSLAVALSPFTLMGALLSLLATLVFLRVAYGVLELQVDGQIDPPRLDDPVFRDGYSLPTKQWIVLLILIGLVYSAYRYLGPTAAVIVGIIVTLAIPASVIVLASTHRVLAAANPVMLVRMMIAIGFPYLAVFVLLLLLNGASVTAAGWFQAHLPGLLGEWIVGFIGFHYTLSMFVLMGYMVYQYHERLGLTPSGPEGSKPPPENSGWSRYRRFMEEENYPAATEALQALMEDEPNNLEYPQLMHRLLRLTADPATVGQQAATLLDRLVSAGKVAQAAEIMEESWPEDEPLHPVEPETHLPLAQVLRQRQSHRQALGLISGFHRRHPGHIDTAELYLLAAQIYAEDQGNDAAARKILDFGIRLLGDDPAVQALEFYRSALSA